MLIKDHVLSDVSNHRYTIKFADSQEEVEAALRLRYNIFNQELDRNFNSKSVKKDKDSYDKYFHHLIVRENVSGNIIGTYRLQTFEQAEAGQGFYTDIRFKLHEFPDRILRNAVEVGRACIAEEHRSGRVLYMLWKGLAGYLQHFHKRYLFGYSAISSFDPAVAWQTYSFLKENGDLHPDYQITIRDEYQCENTEATGSLKGEVDIPPLFQNYLDVGAKVCGGPSMDREKQLIHFLILLDVEEISDQTRKMFFG